MTKVFLCVGGPYDGRQITLPDTRNHFDVIRINPPRLATERWPHDPAGCTFFRYVVRDVVGHDGVASTVLAFDGEFNPTPEDAPQSGAGRSELDALRELEAAIRSCGLPSIMVSGQPHLDRLADALKAVEDARG